MLNTYTHTHTYMLHGAVKFSFIMGCCHMWGCYPYSLCQSFNDSSKHARSGCINWICEGNQIAEKDEKIYLPNFVSDEHTTVDTLPVNIRQAEDRLCYSVVTNQSDSWINYCILLSSAHTHTCAHTHAQ